MNPLFYHVAGPNALRIESVLFDMYVESGTDISSASCIRNIELPAYPEMDNNILQQAVYDVLRITERLIVAADKLQLVYCSVLLPECPEGLELKWFFDVVGYHLEVMYRTHYMEWFGSLRSYWVYSRAGSLFFFLPELHENAPKKVRMPLYSPTCVRPPWIEGL